MDSSLGSNAIAIVDDVHFFGDRAAMALRAAFPEIQVHVFDRPRKLISSGLEFSHALVDLHFGKRDVDAFDPLARETESGVNAIDYLRWDQPECNVAVVSILSNGGPLIEELARAVRSTWPDIPFLWKQNSMMSERLTRFVETNHAPDNAEIKLILRDVVPVEPAIIRDQLRSSLYPGGTVRLLLALAEMPDPPSRAAAAAALGITPHSVRNLADHCGRALRAAKALGEDEQGGLARLWLWAHARRPILERWLAE